MNTQPLTTDKEIMHNLTMCLDKTDISVPLDLGIRVSVIKSQSLLATPYLMNQRKFDIIQLDNTHFFTFKCVFLIGSRSR